MKSCFKSFLCVFAILFSHFCFSQIDTVFWFAAPEVSTSQGESPIFLRFLTYNNPATVTVSQPANGGFTPIVLNIPANNIDSINLTPFLASVESPGANIVGSNGFKIISTAEISAFYELRAASNKEVFSLKGQKALGINYYTPFQKFWNNAVTAPKTFSSIDIVASQNGTTVLITPRTAIVGHVANSSFSVTLNAGQTYSARDTAISAATSLAGSIVSSNKPIALTLFSGALKNGGCTSSMGDQITNTDFAGTDFIIQKGTASTDRIYIMAIQNATSLTISNTGTISSLINWGETYEYPLTDGLNHIHTTKPVYVWHASGYGCNLSGAQVPGVLCAGTYSTAFTRTTSDSIGLMLYTRTGFEGNFAINGNASLIPSSAFNIVPGTSGAYKAAIIYLSLANVPINSYNKVTNSGDIFGLGVITGGSSKGSSYAYFSDFNSYPFVNAGINDTTCANVNFSLNGIVGGGSITGNWTGTGFGTFQNPSSNIINTYIPSSLDTLISPIYLILTSTGSCSVRKDTLVLYVKPAPIVNAGVDQTVCANNASVLLNGNIQGGATLGKWTTAGTGTFSPNNTTLNASYNPSALDISNGIIKLVLTSTNSGTCTDVLDSMHITFTSAAVVNAGPPSISVCSNNSIVSLSGSVTGSSTTGKWTTTGNGLFDPNNISLITDYKSSGNDVSAGNVWLYLSSTSNGNCVQVKDSIHVIYTPSPVVNAGANIIACTNDSKVDLSGTVSGPTTTGVWSSGMGTYSVDSTDLNAEYSPTSTEVSNGSVLLTLTSTNNGGCNLVVDNVVINFVAPPFANFTAAEKCLDLPTAFTDFSLPGYGTLNSWNWTFGDASNSSTQNPSHQYTSAGSYSVQLIVGTNAGCFDTVVKTIKSYELPVADFSYSASCTNNNIVINFTDNSTTVADLINFWFYDFGGQGSVSAQNPIQQFVASGGFNITHIVKTVSGCSDTIVKIVNVPPMPKAGFYYNSSNGLNIGAVFNFIDTSSNTVAYSWNFGDGHSSNLQDPSNTFFANGQYLVTQYVYGALGCVDSTSKMVNIKTVTTEISTLIPNAISPNGDGKNDVWKLEFIQLLYPNTTVQIFNQWAQLLFNSTGYTTPWDGTYHNEPVPDGTYYYVINLNDGSDKSLYKGTLLVLKKGN